MEVGFIWKGIHSQEKNIKITSLPQISTPSKRENKIIIPGRNGYLTDSDDTYEGEVKSVTFDYFDDKFDDIKSWLCGSGNVVFSNEPDRYYVARIVNKISLDTVLKKFNSGIIQFDCQPFGYDINENIIIITQAQNIYNSGYDSEPYMKVYGSGDITLTINNRNVILNDVVDFIELDSEMMNCYKGTQATNDQMVGEFPIFMPGENNISWIGNVIKIEINPRWRWL